MSPQERERVCRITMETFFYSSTRTIRVLLGMSSFAVASIFLINAIGLGANVTDRPTFIYMKVVGNDFFWAALFYLHFVGVLWRVYRIRPCIWCGVGVNFFGLVLWLYSTAAVNLGVGLLLPTSGMAWVMCFSAAWTLYRTGFDQEDFIVKAIERLR